MKSRLIWTAMIEIRTFHPHLTRGISRRIEQNIPDRTYKFCWELGMYILRCFSMKQHRDWRLNDLGELMKVNTTILKNMSSVNQNWKTFQKEIYPVRRPRCPWSGLIDLQRG